MAKITFYSKGSSASIAALDPNETYYTDDTNKQKINFAQTKTIYELAGTYDELEKDNYYSYDKLTGQYSKLPTIDAFKNGQSYYLKKSYPLIPCDLSQRYFINKGYQQVSTFKAGITYYTRTSNLDPETGEWLYTYTKAVSIKEDTWWYQDRIDGTQHSVGEGQNFERGTKYYKRDANGNKIAKTEFLIPYEQLFVDHGYVQVTLSENDAIPRGSICYILDSNNKPVWLNQGYFMMGKTNYWYKPEDTSSGTLSLNTFNEGTYYAYDARTKAFFPLQVLKKFLLYSTYYSSTDADYLAVNKDTEHFYSNYYIRIPTSFGLYLYFPWSDVFDFSKHLMTLYVISEEGNLGYLGRGTNNQRKFAVVDQDRAIYDPNTKYYAQSAVDKHLYEVVPQITRENFKDQPWNLYIRNENQKFKMLKHIEFKKPGTTAKTKDDRIVTVTGTYHNSDQYDPKTFWSYIANTPEKLNFWFDFLDTDGELARYSNPAIGNRPKAENDSNVKAIYYRDTPNVIFVDSSTPADDLITLKQMKSGHVFINLTDSVENLFTISAQGKSAQDELNQLLYNYTYCTEAVTINTLPVYHLNPNCRVLIQDKNSGINGEYIITKITVPLTYNGTMNISATKAVERIY